ncbi:Cloroperoxidase, partial [Sistotremastrum niveocremeum HHB9708]
NVNRRTAAPITSQFPYSGAKSNGLPGLGKGNVLVPDPADTAHAFQPPPPGAMRGPCPGMNALANHGFISRDGITTFDELVQAQQNVWNTGYDLAVLLATLGVALDGDILTEKLSIGGDATPKTALLGLGLLGKEGGLDTHNTFEADASLTRSDFFLPSSNGDNHSFNSTLFAMMTSTVSSTSSPSAPLYDLKGLSLYRAQRWSQSVAENPNFYFGPKALLLYGAATFLYELYPTNGGLPDKSTFESFFGAVPSSTSPSGYTSQPERIPPSWFSRSTPYTIPDVAIQILEMYTGNPVLFGGNTANGSFDAIFTDDGLISDGRLSADVTGTQLACLIYQLVATDETPDSLSNILKLPIEILNFITGKLNPIFEPLGCPLNTD